MLIFLSLFYFLGIREIILLTQDVFVLLAAVMSRKLFFQFLFLKISSKINTMKAIKRPENKNYVKN